MSEIVWTEEGEAATAEATPETPKDEGDKPKAIPVVSVPEPSSGDVPRWAIWPEGLRAPRGRPVFFARFPSNWTDTPDAGVELEMTPEEVEEWTRQGVAIPKAWRQAIFWPLSLGDQKLALGRANGDPNRMNGELAKQMIRAIDGQIVDRTGMHLDLWWERIGERCRSELTRMCLRIHTFSVQERALFLGHCVAARTAG